MNSNVGSSINSDSYQNGIEVAKDALKGLQNPKVAILYTSIKLEMEKVIEGAKSVLGSIPIIGCTSSGAIMVPEGIIDSEQGYSGMMILDDENLTVSVAASPSKGNARMTGRKIALEAIHHSGTLKRPSYFYMVASPKEEENYLKGIEDIVGRIPMFGGSAADDAVSGDWKIFTDQQIFEDGCAILFFYTTKRAVTEYTGAYRETEKRGIITAINGRTLVEIDHEPALKKYAQMIGEEPENLMGLNLLSRSILNPLGIKDPLGDLILIRHPMVGNEDMTMNLGNNLSVGTSIIIMESTVDELIFSAKETVKSVQNQMNQPIGAYLLIHCGGRKLGIAERMNEVYQNLLEATAGVPFLVAFTFGEYGYHEHSANSCGGLMLSFTGFEK